MKLILINQKTIKTYHFNKEDGRSIASRCKQAGKQWGEGLLGFFINISNNNNYAAVTIKSNDGAIESMEYVDIDTLKPEFAIDDEFLKFLSSKDHDSEISLTKFEPILTEILYLPKKARRWEVYPEISQRYPSEH